MDARTILKTNIKLDESPVKPGHYIHIGLRKQIDIVCSLVNDDLSSQLNILHLLFNIDGLPLFKSSAGEVYPILFCVPTVSLIKNHVFPVGIYYGKQKPEDVTCLLNKFLDELIDILRSGVEYKGKHIAIKLLGFCCDAPAKSYIMGVVGHGGYYSCTRCHV